MSDENFRQHLSKLVPANYLDIALDSHKSYENAYRILFEKQKIPDHGWPDQQIERLVTYLFSLDSNNFLHKCGIGEREARIACKLVANRHYNFGHGIGRSGDLDEPQPKAVGSTIMNRLTNAMLLDLIQLMGVHSASKAILIPMATGMTLSLCMATLKQRNAAAKYVLWSRIDQKSCFKSMLSANLTPIVIDQIPSDKGLITNVDEFHLKIIELGPTNIVCILSTTSCFAPRQCDNIIALAELAKTHSVPHIVNNAYGLQSKFFTNKIEHASRVGRIDMFVQSTDKNLLVPVGGAIVAGREPDAVRSVGKMYAGRASSSQTLDVFMTLLSLGRTGYATLVKERETLFKYLYHSVQAIEERHIKVVPLANNPISVAISLVGFGENVGDIGSMMFKRNVSGARVISGNDTKQIESYEFQGWGGHTSESLDPYLTVAAGIGITAEEIDCFVLKLRKILIQQKSKISATKVCK